MSNLKDKQGEEEVKEAWKEKAKRDLVRYFSNNSDGGYANAEICFSMVFRPIQSELTRLTEENEGYREDINRLHGHLLVAEKRIQELEQGIREVLNDPITDYFDAKLYKSLSSLLSSKDKTE